MSVISGCENNCFHNHSLFDGLWPQCILIICAKDVSFSLICWDTTWVKND